MAFLGMPEDLLGQISKHFQDARPLIPMYGHLILSALFPIYTGAHASLSRPSSAAKPTKKGSKNLEEGEDEDEDKVQQMEGMSNKDAIVLPLTAAIVLGGLYFLIMRYGADLINLVLGWYFSGVGVYSVTQLLNDGLNFANGFLFPNTYASNRALWQVTNAERRAVRQGSKDTKDSPLPPFLNALPLPSSVKTALWSLRRLVKQKYTLKAYMEAIVDLRLNITIINVLSAALGVGTIIYVNTVSKPWFLTNLQGFAVSYSALQLMSPTTFSTGSLILAALFCYDIWAVFFTPLMVTVAKNLDQPIKLVFPRPDEPSKTPGEPPVRSYSMLGLGDIVLPGIMIGLALRFDLYLFYLRKQTRTHKAAVNSDGEKTVEEVIDKAPYVTATGRWGDRFWTSTLPRSALPERLRTSFPKPYFTAAIIGYVIGMLTTLGVMSVFQHAQPALLYLVPGVLISIWGTGLVRRELTEMWGFSEAITGDQLADGDGEAKADEDEKSQQGLFERLWAEIWPFGDTKDKPKEAEDESQSSAEPSKSSKDGDLSKATEGFRKKGIVFSVVVSRYDPSQKDIGKYDGDDQSTGDGQSKATATSSSSDFDGTPEPRYRTRSTRSPSE
ncbi:hypothetical protein LTR09_006654 [Extremus antarcticus]|uniref:Signal peptide peptidase n=1 Tax=Extremus antarcticus TaxID=702011 RepID=A0AAJ0GDC6_9PEZI|nr:hypothetical protein LTR09_006654 [Extremus antarcticus]